MSALARTAVSKGLPGLLPAMVPLKDAPSASRAPQSPLGPSNDLLKELELRAQSAQQDTKGTRGLLKQDAASPSSPAVDVQGTQYEVYVGASLKLYSSAKREKHLRGMHDVDHRELRIAKIAAAVADFLWPNCQTAVDDAIAASKKMSSAKRIEAEQAYEPPKVPSFLCFTSWLRNNDKIRESFVCTKETRYKPRMSWYNPNDGMIPSGWLQDGLLADLAYYKPLSGTRGEHQKW